MIILTLNEEQYKTAKKKYPNKEVYNIKEHSSEILGLITKSRYENHIGNWGRKSLKLDLDKLLQLRNAGCTLQSIARKLGCSRDTVYRRLKVINNGKREET